VVPSWSSSRPGAAVPARRHVRVQKAEPAQMHGAGPTTAGRAWGDISAARRGTMRRTGYEPRANSRRCHTGPQALAALLLVAATAGCVSTRSPATPNLPDQPLTTTHSAASSSPTTGLGRGDDRPRSTRLSTSISGGWTFTTYYTAVQSFHSGGGVRSLV
jgi:hypothetical protein